MNYKLLKNAISRELASFLTDYLLMKEANCLTLGKPEYSLYNKERGVFGDGQVDGAFAIYGDPAMENFLIKFKKNLENIFDMKLVPTYTYARVYRTGNILHRHHDRPSCKLSTTLNLGGDPYPIYLEDNKEIEILLNPGDMLAYRGVDLFHWRNKFKGAMCAQAFLHYSDDEKLLNDRRAHLGLPGVIKENDRNKV